LGNQAAEVKAEDAMKETKYVAVALVMTVLLGFSPQLSAEDQNKQHVPGQGETSSSRPAGAPLFAERYTLLEETIFEPLNNEFNFDNKNLAGVEKLERIKKADFGAISKFIKMSKNFRMTLANCLDTSDDEFTKVMDAHMKFLVEGVYDETTKSMKKDGERKLEAKFLGSYIAAAEAYFKKQKEKFPASEQKWNTDYLVAAKAAYKALHKEDFNLEEWNKKKIGFSPATIDKPLVERQLSDAIIAADAAVISLDSSTNACLVKGKEEVKKDETPPVKKDETPVKKEEEPTVKKEGTPEKKDEKVALNASPALNGNENNTPTPTPSTPPVTQNPPLVNPNDNQAPPPVNPGVDGALADLQQDVDNDLNAQEDDLRRLRDQLRDQIAEIERLQNDRNAIVQDRNNNDNALADALAALGQRNETPPFIPPQTPPPPQLASNDEGDETPPVQPQPGQQQDPNQGMGFPGYPPQQAPQPQVLAASEKDKNSNLFDDLTKSNKRDLPNVSDQALNLKTLQDLAAANRELADARMMQMQQGGQYAGGNTVASRMGMGVGNSRTVRSNRMMSGSARSGAQGKMGVNSQARGNAVPSSLKARAASVKR